MKSLIAAALLMSSLALAGGVVNVPPEVDGACGSMDRASFEIYATRFRDAWYDSNRLELLANERPALSSSQVNFLMEEMDDDAYRVKAVELIAPRLVDPQNRFVFYAWFEGDAAQQQLARIFHELFDGPGSRADAGRMLLRLGAWVLLTSCATVGSDVGQQALHAAGANPPGRCTPDCEAGFRCDAARLTCVQIPCGGRCTDAQTCDQSGPVEKCVPKP